MAGLKHEQHASSSNDKNSKPITSERNAEMDGSDNFHLLAPTHNNFIQTDFKVIKEDEEIIRMLALNEDRWPLLEPLLRYAGFKREIRKVVSEKLKAGIWVIDKNLKKVRVSGQKLQYRVGPQEAFDLLSRSKTEKAKQLRKIIKEIINKDTSKLLLENINCLTNLVKNQSESILRIDQELIRNRNHVAGVNLWLENCRINSAEQFELESLMISKAMGYGCRWKYQWILQRHIKRIFVPTQANNSRWKDLPQKNFVGAVNYLMSFDGFNLSEQEEAFKWWLKEINRIAIRVIKNDKKKYSKNLMKLLPKRYWIDLQRWNSLHKVDGFYIHSTKWKQDNKLEDIKKEKFPKIPSLDDLLGIWKPEGDIN